MHTTNEDREQLAAWLAGSLPDGWFTGAPSVTVDREEVLVMGTLPDVDLPADTTDAARETARRARIDRWREETRGERMRIADDVEHRYGRKADDRIVLDTLVEAGVARSRSEALAWCVKLVGKNESAWIAQLRDAMEAVAKVRGEGPGA